MIPTAVRRRPRRVATLVAVALSLTTLTAALAPSAGAAPVDDKRSKAAKLQDQIDASDLQISGLAEQLLGAETRRDTATQAAVDAAVQIDRARQEVDRILSLVRESAASLYRRTTSGTSADGIDFGDASDLTRRSRYARAQAEIDNARMRELEIAQQDLAIQRAEARKASDAAATETAQINEAKTALETARAEQQALLDKVKGEIAAALAAERARRAAEARAKFAASASVSRPNVGAPNGSASQAIAYARGVIGAGYSTNPRMGPTYDCSGLTRSAWEAAGVAIPNNSTAQYAGLPHIPLDAVQPGDLIFYGAGGSSHVALYVGGGMIIDASGSQNAVTERPVWGSPIGAARVV